MRANKRLIFTKLALIELGALAKQRAPTMTRPGLSTFICLLFSLSMVSCHEGCDIDQGWYGSTELGACYSIGWLTNDATRADTMDWFTADAFCQDAGGHLATVRTQAQQDYLRTWLGTVVPYRVWIGANDLQTEGVWEWGYDTGDLVVYNSWGVGEEPDGGTQENCASLHNENNYYWADYHCDDFHVPLCEVAPK